MERRTVSARGLWVGLLAFVACGGAALAQAPGQPGRGGPGAPSAAGSRPGGPGGPIGPVPKLVKQFDKDSNGGLKREERHAARQFVKRQASQPRGGPGFGPGFGPGVGPGFGPGFAPPPAGHPAQLGRGHRPGQEPPRPGPRVSPAQVKSHPNAALYEPTVLRTIFLDFENADWEAELADFRNTDVEVPAILTTDGKRYPNVGVQFRGASSYFMVGEGWKRSLNVTLDLADAKQRLYGHKTLNLLNANGDPTFLRAVLYSHIARQYLPTPNVNLVKAVINGESWGVYVNQQQFNDGFLREWFPDAKGIRWKVPGSPGGGGSLAYLGEQRTAYERLYEIKTDDPQKAAEGWKGLITLCRALNQTPPERLEATLAPVLDLDGALRFLALENVLINSDGYWIRASDYCLFRDATGKFHIIPHDINEALQPAGGPGFGPGPGGPPGFGPGGMRPFGPGGARGLEAIPGQGPPGRPGFGGAPGGRPAFGRGPGFGPAARPLGRGVELDPLTGADDPGKPLLSRLLVVPGLRARYLQHVRTITEQSLDWQKLRPIVEAYRALIEAEVAADTRKLDTLAAFKSGLGLDAAAPAAARDAGPAGAPGPRGPRMNLREFVEQRRAYLLKHPEVAKASRR